MALLVGPANAGKVARLLDLYLASLDREPVLIVPTRGDVERVERDLLTRSPGLFGGWIGTFDDLFRRILAREAGGRKPPLTPIQRSLLLSRVVGGASLNGLSASARFPGFADALGDAIADLESGLLGPEDVDGDLARLYASYRSELERLELSDADLERGRAADLIAGELSAWGGEPLFAYGFEDLTGAQWKLLEALAGRTEVTVSLPYEAGRPVFASLQRTATDLSALSGDRIEELGPQDWYDAPALAHLANTLFEEASPEPPPLDGAVRFLEAAGSRGALELVGDEILTLLRSGLPAQEIAVVCPSVERYRAPLETAFGSLGVPYAIEGRVSLPKTAFGHALTGLLRFAWLGGSRRDLFSFLRSPYSGLPRTRADFVEGRLRGRAVSEATRVEEEALKVLGHPIPALADLRAAEDPGAAVQALAQTMLRAAYGLESPPTATETHLDLRAYESVGDVTSELEGGRGSRSPSLGKRSSRRSSTRPSGFPVRGILVMSPSSTSCAFAHGDSRPSFCSGSRKAPFRDGRPRRRFSRTTPGASSRRRGAAGASSARTSWPATATCSTPLALDPGSGSRSFARRPRTTAGLASRAPSTKKCGAASRRPRWIAGPGGGSCQHSRGTWSVRRPSANGSGRPRPSRRETTPRARALAVANGWERRIERALTAFSRETKLTHPAVLAELREQTRYPVTALEMFGDCSSMWLFNRVVDPRTIDAELDPRLRGQVAHQALYKFYSGLPKRMGVDRLDPERLDEGLEFLRECLAEAVAGQVRMDLSDVELLELEGTLARDLELFVRQELELAFPLVPRRFEVAFGSDRAPIELQRGLDLGDFTLSGKIDRIDVDPFSARGIVQDYKSGKTSHSAAQIESEGRLQIPLYILALRDLVGIEPIGGLYRALAGSREARGLVREDAKESDLPGLKKADYLDEEAFWSQVEAAKDLARVAVGRMRAGDVRHDPRSGTCPTWCDRWSMCRVKRA